MESDKKLKLALVGTGTRGVLCFGDLIVRNKNCELAAVVDPNPIRAERAKKSLKCENALYFADIKEMLDSFVPDAVVITSPDATHCANAVAALQGGCNVLLDKPLATKVSDCQKIIKAADSSSKILMMGFNLRHAPVLKKVKEIISAGTIGKIFMIENREFYDGGRTYMARWNSDYAISGGLWIHKGSHDFDVFQWLMDFPKPVRVSSFSALSVLDADHIPFEIKDGVQPGPTCTKCQYANVCKDVAKCSPTLFDEETASVDGYYKDKCIYLNPKSVHDNGITIVEYDNGARAVHTECFVGSVHDRRYTIWGDLGTMEISLTNREIRVSPRWSKDTITYSVAAPEEGHGGADPLLFEAFVTAARNNEASSSTAEQGMWSTACGEAAELSWRQHRTVEIKELFD